jgi:hypothetical protein
MNDRWRKRLSEFDTLRPGERVWEDAVGRADRMAEQKGRPAPRPRPRTVALYVLILVAAVVVAAVAGRATATTAEREPTAMDTEWPRILLSDLRARLPVAIQLVSKNQCFTPQAAFLTSPIYSDVVVVRRTARNPDVADPGAALTDVILRCSVATRDGAGIVPSRARDRYVSELRALARQVGATAGAGASPSDARAWRDLLRADIDTRLRSLRIMIDHTLCTAENNQALNNAINGDLSGYAIVGASAPYLFGAVMREPIVALGAEFLTLASQCFFMQREGGLTPSEQERLRAHLAGIEADLRTL